MNKFAPQMTYIQGEGIQWSRRGTGTAAQSTVSGRTHLRNAAISKKTLHSGSNIDIMIGVFNSL